MCVLEGKRLYACSFARLKSDMSGFMDISLFKPDMEAQISVIAWAEI
jgi:hypothetical protein